MDDVEDVAAILGDAEVSRHVPGLPHPYSPAMARAWINDTNRRLLDGREFVFGCRASADGRLVGIVKLALEADAPAAELAFWIDQSLWGQGYGNEAARRAVTFAFETLGLDKVWGGALDANPASQRVLEKSGLCPGQAVDIAGGAARLFEMGRADFVAEPIFPVLYVAAVALIDDAWRVLLAQRPPGKAMAGLWEFPGGKVEPGERPAGALARELMEELSVHVALADLEPFTIASHRYETFHLLMPLLTCRRWGGEPVGLEGQSLDWATMDSLGDYAMPPADEPLVADLRRLFVA
jgi:8-oxo-dGTP diphosphatase